MVRPPPAPLFPPRPPPAPAPLPARPSLDPLLTRLQQALAQLALVLRRRVELRRIRKGVEAREPEELLEQRGGPVGDRTELRPPTLLDHPALGQAGHRGVRGDPADAGYLGPRDRLQVGHDREHLGL